MSSKIGQSETNKNADALTTRASGAFQQKFLRRVKKQRKKSIRHGIIFEKVEHFSHEIFKTKKNRNKKEVKRT